MSYGSIHEMTIRNTPEKFASPWRKQRLLKKEDIPRQEQIVDLALSYSDLQHRALFILAYLTAGRISEIIPHKYLFKNTYAHKEHVDGYGNTTLRVAKNDNGSPVIQYREKVELNYPGILRKNIFFEEKKGKRLMVVSMQNRKNQNFRRKNLPIPIDKEEKLVCMLGDYINNMAPDDPLFDFKIGKAERIIGKVGMNPHFLRDIRLTHLVTMYDFNSFQLVKFAGWKDARPAEKYVRLSYSDLIDKF